MGNKGVGICSCKNKMYVETIGDTNLKRKIREVLEPTET